jgi:hypothetical protein
VDQSVQNLVPLLSKDSSVLTGQEMATITVEPTPEAEKAGLIK